MFFVDNNLSIHLADGMKAFKEPVTHLQNHFKQDVKDTEFLPFLAQNNWYLITRDLNIRRNPAELKAIKDNGVGVFYLAGKNRNRCQLIRQLVRHWARMKELAKKNSYTICI